jgi:O-antigen/teichoic acid export membrane protein
MNALLKFIKTFIKLLPRHLVVASSAWVSKVIVSLVQIVSIRTLLSYLGEERYAVYTIAFSFTLWFNLADFGLGFSLQNFISEAHAKKESYEKYIITTIQIIVFLLIAALLVVILISSPAQEIIFRKFTFIQEIQNVNIIFFVGIVCVTTVVLSIVYKVYLLCIEVIFQTLYPQYLPSYQ